MPWVAIAFTGEIITSPDGVDWTKQVSPLEDEDFPNLRGLATDGNGTWIISGVGDGINGIMRSTDTINWSLGQLNETDLTPQTALWFPDESAFYVTTSRTGDPEVRGRVHKSSDGITWTTVFEFLKSNDQRFEPLSLCHDGLGNLFSAGQGELDSQSGFGHALVYRSSDAGVSWTGVLVHLDTPFIRCGSDLAATTGGAINLAVGNSVSPAAADWIYSSGDLASWTKQTDHPFTSLMTGLGFGEDGSGNDRWLGGSITAQMANSSNGQQWGSLLTNPTGKAPRAFHWSSEQVQWVMVGAGGAIATSPDGQTWTQQTSPVTDGNYFAVVFAAAANMVLVSAGQCPARFVPTIAILFVVQKDLAAVVLGVDLKISASRNNGVTFTEGTIVDVGTLTGGRRILKATVLLSGQSSGSAMRWKIETLNLKGSEIHSVEMFWG